MKEIDEMDFLGFLKVRAWEARHKPVEKGKKPPVIKGGKRYIDEIWPTNVK